MDTAKKPLCVADLEAQSAFELPDRQAMSCGVYIVYFEDSFNQYVLNNLTLQNAVQLCNFANNWNITFINFLGHNQQSADNNWFKCSIYQQADSDVVNGDVVGGLW